MRRLMQMIRPLPSTENLPGASSGFINRRSGEADKGGFGEGIAQISGDAIGGVDSLGG